MKTTDFKRAWNERERRERLTARRATLIGSMTGDLGLLTAGELSTARGGLGAPDSSDSQA